MTDRKILMCMTSAILTVSSNVTSYHVHTDIEARAPLPVLRQAQSAEENRLRGCCGGEGEGAGGPHQDHRLLHIQHPVQVGLPYVLAMSHDSRRIVDVQFKYSMGITLLLTRMRLSSLSHTPIPPSHHLLILLSRPIPSLFHVSFVFSSYRLLFYFLFFPPPYFSFLVLLPLDFVVVE